MQWWICIGSNIHKELDIGDSYMPRATTALTSSTQPSHIKKIIVDNLLLDEDTTHSIKLSSNRANIIYATHPIVGKLTDFRNLNFLIPQPFPKDCRVKKTIVFHDSINNAATAAGHHQQQLSDSPECKGLVKHYHSVMSKKFLTDTFDDF